MGLYSLFLLAGPTEGNSAWIERFASSDVASFDELRAHPEWLNEDHFREQLIKRIRLKQNPALYGHLCESIIGVEEPRFKSLDDIFSLGLTTPEFKHLGIKYLNIFFERGETIAGTRARILREMLQFDPRNKTYLSAWILSDKLTLSNEDLYTALDGSAIDLSREFDQKAVEELLAKFPQSENTSVMSEWITKTFVVRENKMDSKLLALLKRHPHLIKLKSLQAKVQQLKKPNAEERKKIMAAYEAAKESKTASLSDEDLRSAFYHLVPESFAPKNDELDALKAALKLDHHEVLDPIIQDWEKHREVFLEALGDPEVAAHLSERLMRDNTQVDNALRTYRAKLVTLIAKRDFILSEENPISHALKTPEFMDTLFNNSFNDPSSVREILEHKLGITRGPVWTKALRYQKLYGSQSERRAKSCASRVAGASRSVQKTRKP